MIIMILILFFVTVLSIPFSFLFYYKVTNIIVDSIIYEYMNSRSDVCARAELKIKKNLFSKPKEFIFFYAPCDYQNTPYGYVPLYKWFNLENGNKIRKFTCLGSKLNKLYKNKVLLKKRREEKMAKVKEMEREYNNSVVKDLL